MDFTFPHPSAYIAGLVAAAGAYQGSQPGTSIRSDCKAGISTIHKAAGASGPRALRVSSQPSFSNHMSRARSPGLGHTLT